MPRSSEVTITLRSTEQQGVPDERRRPGTKGRLVDPGWVGIIEVLVFGLDGAVRWDPDSVTLQLPDHIHAGRVGDLDVLRICLGRVGVPVLFDASRVIRADTLLVQFLGKLVESGLMVDVGRSAA